MGTGLFEIEAMVTLQFCPSATYQIKLQIMKNGIALTVPDISFYILQATGTMFLILVNGSFVI